MTPRQVRIQGAAQFIARERALGKGDQAIRRSLLVAETSFAHPCASASLRNLCSPEEIEEAFTALKERAMGAVKGLHPLVLIGGGTAALWLIGGTLRKLAPLAGAAAAGWWFLKEKK